MKFNKKSKIFGMFVLGAVLLLTSAFADIALGSGYYNLKTSIKTTAAELTDGVDNFSVDLIATAKVDGKVFAESISNIKYDINKQAIEISGTDLQKGKTIENYSYHDENQRIYKNFEDGSYSVIERHKSRKNDHKIIENPFEEEQAIDAETIMDALVGGLENLIQIEETDNKKIYIGNISDKEIPSLVNAISSFVFKYSLLDEWTVERLNIPSPKSNIYVKEASGKAIENEEGILESSIFTASMSAKDSKGIEHIYTVEFSIDIKDINSTLVSAPNLDGKEVNYTKEGYEFDEKFIGQYKSNIVEVEGNSFVKRGERIIEITSVANGNLKGSYYEVYDDGYETNSLGSFEFSSNYDESEHYTIINYRNSKGEMKQGVMHRSNMQDLYVSFGVEIDGDGRGYRSDISDDSFTSEFVRVFE
ncbi:MAG: hypothetical protein GX231_06725 [Tissierellia bacterium]|nr:hypothetical protein [Tissierellia bacterium]